MSTSLEDRLYAQLRGQFPELFDLAWNELAQVQPAMTTWLKQTVRAEVETHADEWARTATAPIIRLREATARMSEPGGPAEQGHVPPDDGFLDDEALGVTGTLPAALTAAAVLLWPEVVTPWTIIICVVAVLISVYGVAMVNLYRPDNPFDGAEPAITFATAIGLCALAGMLSTRPSMPSAWWQWAILIVLALITLTLIVRSVYVYYHENAVRDGLYITATALVTYVTMMALQLPWGLIAAAVINLLSIPGGCLLYRRWRNPNPEPRPVVIIKPVAPETLRKAELELEAAMAEWRQAVLETAVKPYVQRRVGEVMAPPFRRPLRIPLAPGLHRLTAGDFLISTDQFAGIRNSMRVVTGGALGVAGPRGVGKSTLMEAYQLGTLTLGPAEQIVVLESVPVRYEAREFALHLYARLCEEVVTFCRTGRMVVVPVRSKTWPRLLGAGAALAAIMLVYIAWVLGITALDKQDLPAWLPHAGWPMALLLAGAGLAALAAYRLRGEKRPVAERQLTGPAVRDLEDLEQYATQRLRRIRFQQHFTHGWSGKVAIPGGPELTRTDSTQLAELAMTYPDVIHDFRTFLTTTVRIAQSVAGLPYPNVAILIDELDKISTPGKASEFINEVKALFSPAVEGCLFVVAVSEDALASFQRRGLPVRDEFDSAFDTIVRVNYLSQDDSFNVLRSRVLGLGTEHLSLIYMLAGGLPRDLIRVTRSLVHREGEELADLAQAVIADDVHEKMDALRTVIVHDTQPEPYASDLIHSLDRISATPPHALTATLRTLLTSPPPAADPDSPSFNNLRLETLGHLYFSLTLLEIFAGPLTEQQLLTGKAAAPTGFDNLARARQLFTVNARASWLAITTFRSAWRLPEIPPP